MQKVRLLGICGSPRKTGNSRYLLERALAAAKDAAPEAVQSELYSFSAKEIGPCISCFRCADLGDCAIEDSFQELRDKWVSADAIIYSVPVYHMGIPGQLKCFIDRLGNSLEDYGGDVSKDLKTVGIVVQGADIFAGQEQVMTYLINHAVCMSCLPVAGDPYESYIGAAGWTHNSLRKDSLQRLHDEGEADVGVTIAAAESLGRRVIQVALVLKTGGVACRDMLTEDGAYGAFLSRLGSSDEPG
jgi:multimeric flavodoxin WrbA